MRSSRTGRRIPLRGQLPRRSAALWLFLLALLHSGQAVAQDAVTCSADGGAVRCELNAADQFDEAIREILESGFTNTLVYRVFVLSPDDDEPIAIEQVTFASVFRLYTDVHYISREGAEGYVERYDWESAVNELSIFAVDLSLPEPTEPQTPPLVVAVVLDVNPVNEEALLEARRWIARSRGANQLFGDNQSFFGNFLNLFLDTDAGDAEARRLFRSDPFEVSP